MRSPVQKLASLGRFHYLTAGLIAILCCLPAAGLWWLWEGGGVKDSAELLPWLGPAMEIVGIAALVDGWILALLLALAGTFLRKHKHRTFCLVIGALAIPHAPFGSVLGAFSVSILMRPDVEALFDTTPVA